MRTTRIINQIPITYNSTGPKEHVDDWNMTDELKEKIIACAKEDAANGVYGGQKLIDLKFNELEKVAPNRKALMSKALSLQHQNKTTEADYVRTGWGKWRNWTAQLAGRLFFGETVKADGPNMHIFDKHGYEILTFTSTAGWVERNSKSESDVHTAFKDVYYEAYKNAKSEVEKSRASEWKNRIGSEGIDVKI